MSKPWDNAMWLEASQTVPGRAGISFTLQVVDPSKEDWPAVSLFGYDHDGSLERTEDGFKIVSAARPWLAMILAIVDNPALVQSIRNQYNDLIAQAKEEQGRWTR